jgi:rhodanese-related sulfurtransferase
MVESQGKAQKPGEQIIGDIMPQQASLIIKENVNNPKCIILDVRTPKEFSGGHIEGAKNLDYHADDFQKKLENMDKNKKYLVYCESGARSSGAVKLMLNLNFTEIYNIMGGFRLWCATELPTTQK